ncbi:MAG: DDE-type integrase/transposase/recombinase [Deltaproteobacteria bacterium]|nr:DDE-type integrase/transposase/recombinase [Deltaproteobacteria bacterium]
MTIYKCGNRECPHRHKAKAKLNAAESDLQKEKSSQFKLCYQYREYHYQPQELVHSSPDTPKVDLSRIHNSGSTLGLILAFYVSYAIPARKTAQILRDIFKVNVSYQTVLNYAAAAAFYCHSFNFKYKGDIDTFQAGDETYIKILGKHNYVFFFISAEKLKITAYHLADNRGTQPAIAAMQEAIRTAAPGQKFVLITDGNPSYPAGIHFLNSNIDINSQLEHHKVIGLQNLDSESEAYRPYKELIERLNRTFKYHVKPAAGFGATNGAMSLTVLFVTHYNFLRPHMSLSGKPPVQLPDLESVTTLQGKWAKILQMAA